MQRIFVRSNLPNQGVPCEKEIMRLISSLEQIKQTQKLPMKHGRTGGGDCCKVRKPRAPRIAWKEIKSSLYFNKWLDEKVKVFASISFG